MLFRSIVTAYKKKIIKTDWHAYWIAKEFEWFTKLGANPNNFRARQHTSKEKSHYAIRMYNDMGLVDGITTNPSLLAKEGGDPQKTMEEISRIIKGDVSLEVVSTDYDGMMEEGRRLRKYGDNVVVKCPMTGDGLKACKSLTAEGIPVDRKSVV